MRLHVGEADDRKRRLLSGWVRLAAKVVRERPLWLALLIGVLAIALAYQSPRSFLVDIGSSLDEPYMVGFHEPEQNAEANYRWSTANSAAVFPGMGKPLTSFAIHMQLSSGPAPTTVGVKVNGHDVPPLKLTSRSTAYAINVDPSWIDASGDVRLDFTSPTFKNKGDKRELGFLADFALVDRPSGLVLPSLTQLLGLLLCAALLYLLLRAVWLTPRATGLLTALFLLACAAIFAVQRLLLTTFTWRLLVTLVIAILVAVLAEVGTRWLVGLAGWHNERRLPEWSWAALRGLVLVSAILKVGGLLYPLTFLIDAPFHLKYVTYMNEVLFHGRSWEQYFGESQESLAFAVMPKEEWGSARAFIPYSPFFYVIATPFAWLPLPMSVTVPVASGIMEALKTSLVFIVGLALGSHTRSGRRINGAAIIAVTTAGIYSIIPATFLLQQFGTWPTLTSLWLITAWVAVTTLFWERITRPRIWVTGTALLTLTLLSYTVTAAYTGIFMGLLTIFGWIFVPSERKRWAAAFLSLLMATVLSLAIYYGQYVGRILGDTLPTFEKAAQTQGSLSTLRPGLGDFLTNHIGRAFYSYDLTIIYVLGFAGTLWVFLGRNKASGRTRTATNPRRIYALVARHIKSAYVDAARIPWQRIWIGAWLLTFPLFTMLDFYVDQAFKEFWYALPAVAVVSGVWLLALLRKGRISRLYSALAWFLAATLAWQSISLWVFRLLFHNR